MTDTALLRPYAAAIDATAARPPDEQAAALAELFGRATAMPVFVAALIGALVVARDRPARAAPQAQPLPAPPSD